MYVKNIKYFILSVNSIQRTRTRRIRRTVVK